MKRLFLFVGATLAVLPARAANLPEPPHEVVFTQATPLAATAEILRRTVTPLDAVHMQAALARDHQVLQPQSIVPAAEKYFLYVPPVAPPQGYGLLVFVPPWNRGRLPHGWQPVLDEKGMIFVSAVASGNESNVLARRMPLALTAAANVMARYPVDPARVFVGGMSGGSRVALRLALAYPDLFRGAFLNAGADPIGGRIEPLPPRDLFARFQAQSRLVYVTGEHDDSNLLTDGASRRSLRSWCVSATDSITIAHLGHEPADAAALTRGLEMLMAPSGTDPRLAGCQAEIDRALGDQMAGVEGLIRDGRRDEARSLLAEIDGRFGGLAAPRSLELDARLSGAAP